MAKSRLAALLALLALAAPAAAAEPLSAEQAMARYRLSFAPAGRGECPRGAGGDVVVCGRREGRDPNRLPLPVEPEPGQRVMGESLAAVEISGKREKCSTVGPNQNCGGGLPVLAIAVAIARVVVETAVKEAVKDD
jgi:hypothetical protein